MSWSKLTPSWSFFQLHITSQTRSFNKLIQILCPWSQCINCDDIFFLKRYKSRNVWGKVCGAASQNRPLNQQRAHDQRCWFRSVWPLRKSSAFDPCPIALTFSWKSATAASKIGMKMPLFEIYRKLFYIMSSKSSITLINFIYFIKLFY